MTDQRMTVIQEGIDAQCQTEPALLATLEQAAQQLTPTILEAGQVNPRAVVMTMVKQIALMCLQTQPLVSQEDTDGTTQYV